MQCRSSSDTMRQRQEEKCTDRMGEEQDKRNKIKNREEEGIEDMHSEKRRDRDTIGAA